MTNKSSTHFVTLSGATNISLFSTAGDSGLKPDMLLIQNSGENGGRNINGNNKYHKNELNFEIKL